MCLSVCLRPCVCQPLCLLFDSCKTEKIHAVVFGVLTPRCFVSSCQSFEATHCLHRHSATRSHIAEECVRVCVCPLSPNSKEATEFPTLFGCTCRHKLKPLYSQHKLEAVFLKVESSNFSSLFQIPCITLALLRLRHEKLYDLSIYAEDESG